MISALRRNVVSVFAGLAIAGPAVAQTIVYVDSAAIPGGDGTTWATAYDDLVDALAEAQGLPAPVEIWVTAGVYTPATFDAPPRDREFYTEVPLRIRGGFVGVESTPEDRLASTPETVLSGDINGDDAPGFVNRGDNTYRTFSYLGPPSTPEDLILDRLTFRGHDSVGAPDPVQYYGDRLRGNTRIIDCRWEDHRVVNRGGALFLATGYAFKIDRSAFVGNMALGSGANNFGGGAIYTQEGVGLTVSRSEFRDNWSAAFGGAVFIGAEQIGDPTFTNCVFVGNHSEVNGGGINSLDGLRINGCLFIGNSALAGGAVRSGDDGHSTFDEIRIKNSTLIDNATIGNGGAIIREGPGNKIVVRNVIFQGNTSNSGQPNDCFDAADGDVETFVFVEYTTMGDGPGTLAGNQIEGTLGRLFDDPGFVDRLGPDGLPGTGDENLRLLDTSTSIDSGSNSEIEFDWPDLDQDGFVQEPAPFDFDGLPRRVDAPSAPDAGEGLSPIVDRGAFERQVDVAWVGSAFGDFSDPGVWSGGSVPGPSDVVVLDGVIPTTIGFSAPAASDRVEIAGGDWTFLMNLGGFEIPGAFSLGSPALEVGSTDAFSRLRIQAGFAGELHGVTAGRTEIASAVGGTARIEVSGVDTFLQTAELVVGGAGSGSLELRQGTEVRSYGDVVLGRDAGSAGSALVRSGSRWIIGPAPGASDCIGSSNDLLIGGSGIGDVLVDSGASLETFTCGELTLAADPGSLTIVRIEGEGSSWIESNPAAVLKIGVGGPAALEIDGGLIAIPTIEVLDGSTLEGNGTIVGDVINFGEIEPGRGMVGGQLGDLVIEGDFEQIPLQGGAVSRVGVTRLRLGGDPQSPMSDRIIVLPGADGFADAQLGGALILAPELGFDLDPQFIGVIDVLSALDVTGEFSVVLAPAVSPDADGRSRFLSLAYEVPGQGFGPGVGESVQITVNILDGDFDGLGDPIGGDLVGTPVAVASADLNPTDGEDFAVALAEGDILITTEVAGVPAQLTLAGVGDELTDLVVGDFDGINGPDIAVTARNTVGTDEVVIAFNDGNGFLLPTFGSIAVADEPVGLAAADFDGDGVVGKDIAVISAAAQSVRVYTNNGVGAFIGQNVIDLPRPPKVIDPLQGTGNKQDQVGFVIASDGDGGVVQAFFEDAGAYSSANSVDIAVGPQPEAQALTDFDGDGLGDLVTVNGDGTLSVALQAAGQDFAPAVSVGIVDFPRDLTVLNLEGDAEGDADLAILSGGPNPVVQVLRNDTVAPGSIVLATHSETAAGVAPLLIDSGLYTVGDPVDDVLIVRGSASDGGWPFPPPNGAGGGKPAEGGFSVFGNETAAPSDPCPTDIDGDGETGFGDLVAVLAAWGPCPMGGACPEDVVPTGVVDFDDLLEVLALYGTSCP